MSQIRLVCISLFVALGLFVALVLAQSNSSVFDPCSYAPEDVLIRDVVVIGGGASGTYGAIALKDMGRSVAVVEKKPHFGGHVNTYTDPETGLALDFGVQGYIEDSITQAFFSRFNVPLIPMSLEGNGQITADFNTGEIVTTPMADAGMVTYGELANMYYPDPAHGIHLPQPVPEDLMLHFGEFITKYSLEDAAYNIWRFTPPSIDILDQLTLYALLGNYAPTTPLLGGQGRDVTTRNNSELYGKAEEELGDSALLSSHVIAANRANDSVSLVVQTSTTKKLILASQVLFSAPIVLDNLNTFDLDPKEHAVFSQIYYSCWYTALVTDTGLQPGYNYENAASDTLYNIPRMPYTFRIGKTRADNIFYAYYGSMEELPETEVKARIAESIQMLSGGSSTPRFLDFGSHVPFRQQVPAQAIEDGFYNQLNDLQGYRGMHYTGNALDSTGSSGLFRFTLNLLPNINQGIDANPVDPSLGVCGDPTEDSEDPPADEDTPDEDTPDEDTPDEDTPDEDTPDEDTPDEDTPDEDTPPSEGPPAGEDTPDEDTPPSEGPPAGEDTPDEDTPPSEGPPAGEDTPDKDTPPSEGPPAVEDAPPNEDIPPSEGPPADVDTPPDGDIPPSEGPPAGEDTPPSEGFPPSEGPPAGEGTAPDGDIPPSEGPPAGEDTPDEDTPPSGDTAGSSADTIGTSNDTTGISGDTTGANDDSTDTLEDTTETY